MPRFPKPHTLLRSGRATYRFYLDDCLTVFDRLPEESIDAIVTSPPYNLGIRYRTYDDTLSHDSYMAWTGDWVQRASARLSPKGSLFLNVDAKPTEPWTAIDVAFAARPHLRLQNTIHWIKSIAIDRAVAGGRAGREGDLAVGHYKPINSRRFLHDSHEFVFHVTPSGDVPLERQAVGVRYQDSSNVGRWRTAASGMRCRGKYVVHPVCHHSEPGEGPPPSRDLSSEATRDVPATSRLGPNPHGGRPVSRTGIDSSRLRRSRAQLCRNGTG